MRYPVPKIMNDVASVVMNELTRSVVINRPLAVPKPAPTRQPTTRPSRATSVAFSTRSANSGATTATAATDRSKPPAIIVIVMIAAATSRLDCWSSTLRMFRDVRKRSVVSASRANRTTVTTTIP